MLIENGKVRKEAQKYIATHKYHKLDTKLNIQNKINKYKASRYRKD